MFIPRNYRSHKTVLYMMAAEFPFVVMVLILTGIASHNTYTTKLWQDGANNGFNSAPNQIVYDLTNGRPYTTPMVWSAFLTNFNLIIGVLSVFMLLAKVPLHVLHSFHPPLSVIVHGALTALFVTSTRYQAGSDMTDPRHPQPGPPWYITKSCSVTYSKSNTGYCMQAKTLFAVSVIICVIYFTQFVLGVWSCFTTTEDREAYRLRQEEKREEKEAEDRALREYDEILKSPSFAPATPAVAVTPGFPIVQSPYTPYSMHSMRSMHSPSMAFTSGGLASSDLPLRNPQHFSSLKPQGRLSVAEVSPPLGGGFGREQPQQSQPYFPPPPKKATS